MLRAEIKRYIFLLLFDRFVLPQVEIEMPIFCCKLPRHSVVIHERSLDSFQKLDIRIPLMRILFNVEVVGGFFVLIFFYNIFFLTFGSVTCLCTAVPILNSATSTKRNTKIKRYLSIREAGISVVFKE